MRPEVSLHLWRKSYCLGGSYRGIDRMHSSGRLILAACVLITSLAPTGAQDQGGEASKAIRMLPPASFPELPLPLREALEKRGCRIPQGAWNPKPHNVITGQFIRPDHTDWAVLCSKSGSSAILVFTEGSPERMQSFNLEDDKKYLGKLDDGAMGYARIIAVADRETIPELSDESGGNAPQHPDHDGIEDMFVDKTSVVLYWNSGKWLKLFGGD